jgi:hypothetical protein
MNAERQKIQDARTDAIRDGNQRLIDLAEDQLRKFDLDQERADLLAADNRKRAAAENETSRVLHEQEQIKELERLESVMADQSKALEKAVDAIPKVRREFLATASEAQEIMNSLGHTGDFEHVLQHTLDNTIINRLHNSGFATKAGNAMSAPPSVIQATASWAPGLINNARRKIARGD